MWTRVEYGVSTWGREESDDNLFAFFVGVGAAVEEGRWVGRSVGWWVGLCVCVRACVCVCLCPLLPCQVRQFRGHLSVLSCRGARAPVISLAQRSQITGVEAVADHHCVPAFGLASGAPVALE